MVVLGAAPHGLVSDVGTQMVTLLAIIMMNSDDDKATSQNFKEPLVKGSLRTKPPICYRPSSWGCVAHLDHEGEDDAPEEAADPGPGQRALYPQVVSEGNVLEVANI